MNDVLVPAELMEGSSSSREIQRDEDVLSLEAQRGLEAVGSALGVIFAFALVASQLGRGRGLASRVASAPSAAPRSGVRGG